jgi:NAD(P)-dependent dehydrogenase (short-subunit alcohol dehydrogenase family)
MKLDLRPSVLASTSHLRVFRKALAGLFPYSGSPSGSLATVDDGSTAYTRSLAVELAHKGVRVNAIAPGMGHG